MERWCISVIVIFLQNGLFSMGISPDILKSASDTPDFLAKFVRMPNGSPLNASLLQSVDENTDAMHISGVGYARLASYDRCEPRYVTVMIEKDPNPNVLLWPPCTRVQRCSGCCPTDVLVCEPIMTEMVSLKVIRNVLPHQGSPEYQYDGMKEVQVERHIKCDQRCRTKAHHCNPNTQDYLESGCRCRCKRRQTCASFKHIWREEKCKCECIQKEICTGFAVFDEATCECVIRQLATIEMTDEERARIRDILLSGGNGESQPQVVATTPPSTPAPTRAPTRAPTGACPSMSCMPGWAPRRFSSGICSCMPPGFGFRGRRRRR